jgi:outer membrane receptor protein involved in Fe transport
LLLLALAVAAAAPLAAVPLPLRGLAPGERLTPGTRVVTEWQFPVPGTEGELVLSLDAGRTFPLRVSREAESVSTIATTAATAQEADATKHTASAEVVVSATKLPEEPVDVAGPVEIISGEILRRSGARTVGEALQNVVGLDTGGGSDNGNRLPNIGMWGLKEFDALLITVDGVPAGGPFNPSLAQIPVEDIDRIEIVKGPQGTLYGVAAFTGMIQVFTKHRDTPGGTVTLGGGSFADKHGYASYATPLGSDADLKVFGSMERGKGWQDRTDYSRDRFSLSGEKRWSSGAKTDLVLSVLRDTGLFGSPLPVDAGQPIPGFTADRNYAVDGARMDHRVTSLASTFSLPLAAGLKLENVLGVTRDEQNSVRSYISSADGNDATAAGVAMKPLESTVYDDLHVAADFEAAGRHQLVAGGAITWGRTTASGTGFDIDLTLVPVVVPNLNDVPAGDHRSFQDRRTFLGFYLNDEWTSISRLTVTAGARYDSTSEALTAFGQEVGEPTGTLVTDERTDGQWSGGASALVRLFEKPAGPLDTANLYVAAKSAFKPAAPNLTEAESAHILDPERVRSGEVGLKTSWWGHALSLDLSLFHMKMENTVVGTLGPDGLPQLVNAGEERFQGMEVDGTWRVPALEGLSIAAGYAHHDATFVHFSFLTPDGSLRVVDGRRLELSPRDMWNVRILLAPKSGIGGFLAVRHQNQRSLTRRNTFYTPSFEEWDAGVHYEFSWGHVGVYGRNLADSRAYMSDSEIGDSQFYIAPPARFGAELTVRF